MKNSIFRLMVVGLFVSSSIAFAMEKTNESYSAGKQGQIRGACLGEQLFTKSDWNALRGKAFHELSNNQANAVVERAREIGVETVVLVNALTDPATRTFSNEGAGNSSQFNGNRKRWSDEKWERYRQVSAVEGAVRDFLTKRR